MLILTQTTDNLQVVLAGNVTTNQLQCVSSWRDVTTSDYTPGRTVVATNNTTDVNVVPAPGASTQRVVDFLSIYNADTVDSTVTVKLDANGTEYVIYKALLASGQSLVYQDRAGFSIVGSYAPIKVYTFHSDAGANFAMTNAAQAARFAGNSTRHIFTVDLVGYSQVKIQANIAVGSASVNTPVFGLRYNNGWSSTYANYSQLGASQAVEISVVTATYVDSGWINLAAGAKIATCYIGAYEAGGDAAADPAFGNTYILFR